MLMSLVADLDDVCHPLILLGFFQELGTQGNFPKWAVPCPLWITQKNRLDSLYLAKGRPTGGWVTCPGVVPRATSLSSVCTYSNRPRLEVAVTACPLHTCSVVKWGPLLLWTVSLGTLGTHFLLGLDITPKLLRDTEQVPAPSDSLTSGLSLPLWLPQRKVGKTVPFVPWDHAVSLAPGLDTEARPGQVIVLGARVRMSSRDQGKPGALAELPGESLPLGLLRGGWGSLVLPVSKLMAPGHQGRKEATKRRRISVNIASAFGPRHARSLN